jgi:hypothetical protein
MAKRIRGLAEHDLAKMLVQSNYLFKGLDEIWVANYVLLQSVERVKLYASQPIYTAFRAGESIDVLYRTHLGSRLNSIIREKCHTQAV